MLFLALPAVAAAPLAESHLAPRGQTIAVVQATATIRVLTSVRVRLDGTPSPDTPPPRDSTLGAAGEASQPIKVIEFQ